MAGAGRSHGRNEVAVGSCGRPSVKGSAVWIRMRLARRSKRLASALRPHQQKRSGEADPLRGFSKTLPHHAEPSRHGLQRLSLSNRHGPHPRII